jgi:hypothetical protein
LQLVLLKCYPEREAFIPSWIHRESDWRDLGPHPEFIVIQCNCPTNKGRHCYWLLATSTERILPHQKCCYGSVVTGCAQTSNLFCSLQLPIFLW